MAIDQYYQWIDYKSFLRCEHKHIFIFIGKTHTSPHTMTSVNKFPKSPTQDIDYNAFMYDDTLYESLFRYFRILKANNDCRIEDMHPFQLQTLARHLQVSDSRFKRQINADDTGLGKTCTSLACGIARFMPRLDEPLDAVSNVSSWSTVKLYKHRIRELYDNLTGQVNDYDSDQVFDLLCKETTLIIVCNNDIDENWYDQIDTFYGSGRAYTYIIKEGFSDHDTLQGNILDFFKDAMEEYLSISNKERSSQLPPSFFIVCGLDRAKTHCFYKTKGTWNYDKTSIKEPHVADDYINSYKNGSFKFPYDERRTTFDGFFIPDSIFLKQFYLKIFDECHLYFNAASTITHRSAFAMMLARSGFGPKSSDFDSDQEEPTIIIDFDTPASVGLTDDYTVAVKDKHRIMPIRLLCLSATPITNKYSDIANFLLMIRVYPHLDYDAARSKILRDLSTIGKKINEEALKSSSSSLKIINDFSNTLGRKRKQEEPDDDSDSDLLDVDFIEETKEENKTLIASALNILREYLLPYMISRRKMDPALNLNMPPIVEHMYDVSPYASDLFIAAYNGLVIVGKLTNTYFKSSNDPTDTERANIHVLTTIECLRQFPSDPHSALAQLHFFSLVNFGHCSLKQVTAMLYFFIVATIKDNKTSNKRLKTDPSSSCQQQLRKLSDHYPDLISADRFDDFDIPNMDLCDYCFAGLSCFHCKRCGKDACLHCIIHSTKESKSKYPCKGICPDCFESTSSYQDYSNLKTQIIRNIDIIKSSLRSVLDKKSFFRALNLFIPLSFLSRTDIWLSLKATSIVMISKTLFLSFRPNAWSYPRILTLLLGWLVLEIPPRYTLS